MAGLTQPQALGLLVIYCIVYVLPLHMSPATRASPNRSRDDPAAIRARVRAVSLSTAACSLATLLVLLRLQPPPRPPYSSADAADALRRMGYWPPGLVGAVDALALTAALFAGPLYERLVVLGDWRDLHGLGPLRAVWRSWPAWRNLVAGPITEECLFRSAAVPLLLLAGSSMKSTIFLSPLVFGLAHVHHFYEFRITHPQVPLATAIVTSVFQFSYTYLFGIYATFLFLRTGSLLAVILVHAFCNLMGLPRFWGLVEPYWLSSSELDAVPAGREVKVWSGLYYVLLFGGVFIWLRGLYPLTESAMALANV